MAEEPEVIAGVGESWIGRGHQALLRAIGPGGALVLGLSAAGLSYSGLLPFSTIAGMWAGADLPGILTVALVISLVVSYTYAVIGSAVARSGADYLLASRVLSAPAAFASSWIFVMIGGLAAGSAAAFIPRVVLPAFSRVLAAGSGVTDLVNLIQQPQVMVLIGTLLVATAYFSMFVPQRIFIRILGIGCGLILAAWGVFAFVFAQTTPDAFAQSWNHVMGAGSFEGVVPTAQAMTFFPAGGWKQVVLAGAFLALFVFFGFFITTFVAGEIRKPERSLWRSSAASLVISWIVLAGTSFLLERAVSLEWLSAQSYLGLSLGFMGQADPYVFVYGAVLLPAFLAGIVLAAWIYSLVNLVQVYLFSSSRILLAWAEDGLLPAGMAYVHPRYRSPLVTMLLAAALVETGMVNQLLGGFFTSPLNYAYFAVVSMLVPVTAVTFFPFLQKNWFRDCPPFVRKKIGPLPVVTLTGLLTLLYLICLVIAPMWVPGGIAPSGPAEIIIFGLISASGLAWYWGRRMMLRSIGYRLEETFKTLPSSSIEH